MGKYILEKDYELCGWDGLPFALRHPRPEYVDFFDRESYVPVLFSDGKHEIDPGTLTEKQKKVFDGMTALKMVREATENEQLEPWQEYKQFGCMYKREVQWSVTGRCNYKCRHCFMSAPQARLGEPTLEQCLHVIDELASCGIRAVGLTGGEPFVRKDLPEILDALAARNMEITTVYTNGELLTDEMLDMLSDRGLCPSFQLSYDGVGWHDWLRGIDGAEKSVRRAFELLGRRNVPFSAAMSLHKHNIGTLTESIKLLAEYGCGGLKSNIATPAGNWADQPEHFIGQEEAYNELLRVIPEYFEAGAPLQIQFDGMLRVDKRGDGFKLTVPFARFKGMPEDRECSACAAMRETMYIDPKGCVLPCMTMAGTGAEDGFPSVFDTPLRQILKESYYLSACRIKMGTVTESSEKCVNCRYRDVCGAGCRAAGFLDHGNMSGIDEACCSFFRNGWYEKAKELIAKYEKAGVTG